MKISKIGPKSKIEFVWIFFQKTKCTNSGDKNPEGQVCNPKNIPTVEVYFSNFPNGTPCRFRHQILTCPNIDAVVVNPFWNSSFQNITIFTCHILVTRIYIPASSSSICIDSDIRHLPKIMKLKYIILDKKSKWLS